MYDISKDEIRHQWMSYNYILMLWTLFFQFLSNGTAKTKLAVLAFLFWGVCEKPYCSSCQVNREVAWFYVKLVNGKTSVICHLSCH